MKQIFITVGLLLALLAGVLLYMFKFDGSDEKIRPHLAMPKSVGVNVQFPDLYQFLDKLSTLKYGEQIQEAAWLKAISENKNFLPELLLLLDSNQNEFDLTQSLIGFTLKNNDQFNLISVIDYQGNKKFDFEYFSRTFEKQEAKFSAYNFDGQQIYNIENWKNHPAFALIFYKNLLIVSFQNPLVEEALQTLKYRNEVSDFEQTNSLHSDLVA